MIRRILIGALIVLSIPVMAFAKDCRGYIRLKLLYEGQPVTGGTVTLYDVSDSPEGLGPLEMLVYVKELGISGTEVAVDATGCVTFDDLPAGLYLLVQQKAAAGFYPCNPFLARLSPAAGGTQIGSIDAAPKMEREKKLPQTGQLVWPVWVLLGMGILFVGFGLSCREQ